MTGHRGGRPRDPQLEGRVLATARRILAEQGLTGFTSDAIAAAAGVGKASIYRRWSSLDELLDVVVRGLGIREVPCSGTTRQDLVLLMQHATRGEAAAAERAVMGVVGRSSQLASAYAAGPEHHRYRAAIAVENQAIARGENEWPSAWPVLAGILQLQHGILTRQLNASNDSIRKVVDDVVLPALGYLNAATT